MALKLVPPESTPPLEKLRQRIRANNPGALLQCRCGCREAIEVKSGMVYKDGKAQGGTKQVLCAHCFMKGERRVLA